MLGVLLRRGKDDAMGLSADWLEVAWGDQRGQFLGWEKVVSMAVVHGIRPRQVRHFKRHEEWESIEMELKDRSWGRDL